MARYSNVDHILKLNSRRTYTVKQWMPRFEEADVAWHPIRGGKYYATLPVIHDTDYGQKRLVIRIIRRTSDGSESPIQALSQMRTRQAILLPGNRAKQRQHGLG
ncbi:MAG: hypothetical protein KAG53_00520 [Endozoicomonadaceae bacterium]|nr:hypothetical protein [Endozoicomonadaceae bacterium]